MSTWIGNRFQVIKKTVNGMKILVLIFLETEIHERCLIDAFKGNSIEFVKNNGEVGWDIEDLSHFTFTSSNGSESLSLYQQLYTLVSW